MKHLFALAALPLLAACAAPQTGYQDPAEFAARAARVEIASATPATDLGACFRDRALLLPGSTLLADPDGKGATYALRVAGYSFEEIRFRPAGRGSVATVLTAPGAGATFQAEFERDRLAPLRACATG
jgi:hypothetical protein